VSEAGRLRQFPAGIRVAVGAGLQLHTIISLGLAVGTTAFAAKYGGQTARRFAFAFLACWMVSLAANKARSGNIGETMFFIDSVTLVYFVWASLRSRQIWTAVASAFMAIIVASHVATAIDFRVAINTFRLSMALWSYGILACIAFGTWSNLLERSRASALATR
jgi:hypothetical protein